MQSKKEKWIKEKWIKEKYYCDCGKLMTKLENGYTYGFNKEFMTTEEFERINDTCDQYYYDNSDKGAEFDKLFSCICIDCKRAKLICKDCSEACKLLGYFCEYYKETING
jgi:hypothetical protein